MTFVGDYRPTKRVGIEELDGAIKLLFDRINEAHENGEATVHHYEGAWLALDTIRNGRFEYPADFMAVFENQLNILEGGE